MKSTQDTDGSVVIAINFLPAVEFMTFFIFILCEEWRSELQEEQKSQNFAQNSLHVIQGQDP